MTQMGDFTDILTPFNTRMPVYSLLQDPSFRPFRRPVHNIGEGDNLIYRLFYDIRHVVVQPGQGFLQPRLRRQLRACQKTEQQYADGIGVRGRRRFASVSHLGSHVEAGTVPRSAPGSPRPLPSSQWRSSAEA